MIDRAALLSDLQKLLQRLEADLLARSESADVPEVGEHLRGEYQRAKTAQRTAQNYEDWRSDSITQTAAAWVLSCVFVRFLEDNRLIDPPKIAGPGTRLQQARDEWELYLGKARQPNERDYLLGVFDELARLPGTKEVFGLHNPIRELPNWLSGDGAREMLTFFQQIDADTGTLVHDFTDLEWETRFLGDLYQDLSEAARKKYALLQTPEFVEEFILDRTLEPALNEFGRVEKITTTAQRELPGVNLEGQERLYVPFRMIDPACGSGHFLLGSFRRILDRWQRNEPAANIRDLVQRTLDSIHGVDINPYAVAIARFRLLLVAMKACGVKRLADAPAFHFNLACGDSLLHGAAGGDQQVLAFHELAHVYQSEDAVELRRILRPGQFHAVVANPPYINPSDAALNEAYRVRYKSCYSQYQLVSVPSLNDSSPRSQGIGICRGSAYVGTIVGNAFMKAKFGKRLIEDCFPKWELTHVVDTSGAHIPGHGTPDGTPTAILFLKNQLPVRSKVRVLAGLRSEPGVPSTLADGAVWSSIVEAIDCEHFENDFIAVLEIPTNRFHSHPWSIGGGGAAELKEELDRSCEVQLEQIAELPIGRAVRIAQEDVFIFDRPTTRLLVCQREEFRGFLVGENVRDWTSVIKSWVWYPYYSDDADRSPMLRHLWQWRTTLRERVTFQGNMADAGLRWYEYQQHTASAYKTPLSLVYAFTATHNHFVLDRGGNVFKQTVAAIKLPKDQSEDSHFALLGLLNSSVACFWLRQVCFPRGGYSAGKWEERFNFNSTPLQAFPVPADKPTRLAIALDGLSRSFTASQPQMQVRLALPDKSALVNAAAQADSILAKMIMLQEELDWWCYRAYGLTDEDTCYPSEPIFIQLGQRAFEIVMARKMAAGELQTTWFERHGSTPITDLPADWPDDFKRLIERRIELIERNHKIAVIEQPGV